MRKTVPLVFALFCFVCPDDCRAADERLSDRLLVYSCFVESENAVLFDAFTRETGIAVKHVRLSAGEAVARIAAEAGHPQVSLLLGGAVDAHMHAAANGLLDNYVSRNIGSVAPEFRDPAHIFTPVSIVVTAFVSNRRWLDENGFAAPKSWRELLEPRYEGEVCVAHPATSGAAYTAFSSVVQLFGEEEGFDYLRRLDRNILHYTKAGAAPMRMVGMGEAGVAIGYDLDGAALRAEGYPLVITYPEEGTGYEVTCASLVKGGPPAEVENARRFVDWLLEPDTQRLLNRRFFRIPVNREVEPSDAAVSLDEIETIDYDVVWSAANKSRLVTRFEWEVRGRTEVR